MMYQKIGIIGAGAMGSGIAQVAATAGCDVLVYDADPASAERSAEKLSHTLTRLQEKGKIPDASRILNAITYVQDLTRLSGCQLVIEAIIEDLDVKMKVFNQLEQIVHTDCVLASNTSSLSITSIAAACQHADRVLGIHFFNPAPLMPLVEVIPAIQTRKGLGEDMSRLMRQWGKSPVLAKDTPGFIVNRIARPFYGEAMRIMEEQTATAEEIDLAITGLGGFKMGPFELTDYIGHDVNYIVTETVFRSFYYDARYKPSLSQKRLLEAGWLGRKSGRGFYDYSHGEPQKKSTINHATQQEILHRILAMLINEAVDALYLGIASAGDIETAMTKGVNYPKGLLQWCNELGADHVLSVLDELYHTYHEDRYRASPLLRKHAATLLPFDI